MIAAATLCGCARSAGSGDPHKEAAPNQPAREVAVHDAAPAPSRDAALVEGYAAPVLARGCGAARRRPTSADPALRGPWPVGVRTAVIAGLVSEVWYPARPGSELECAPVDYDLREQLPRRQRSKIADDVNPLLRCDCYRDLPIDDGAGPYPVVVFVHGYTLFRIESVFLTTHWASRGFGVVAPELPAVTLAGVMGKSRRGREVAQVSALLAALPSGDGGDFLDGRADFSHLALVGHSLGGAIVARLGGRDNVEVVISMAEGGVGSAKRKFSTLIIGGTSDAIEEYSSQVEGFVASPGPKRLLGIRGAGHMAFSDLCAGGFLALARRRGVTMSGFVAKMARQGCSDGTLALVESWPIIRYATTAALEEKLWCDASATGALTRVGEVYGDLVAEYREEL